MAKMRGDRAVSTVEKSAYDWEGYKDEHGVKKEVEEFAKDGCALPSPPSQRPTLGAHRRSPPAAAATWPAKSFCSAWMLASSSRKRSSAHGNEPLGRRSSRGPRARLAVGCVRRRQALGASVSARACVPGAARGPRGSRIPPTRPPPHLVVRGSRVQRRPPTTVLPAYPRMAAQCSQPHSQRLDHERRGLGVPQQRVKHMPDGASGPRDLAGRRRCRSAAIAQSRAGGHTRHGCWTLHAARLRPASARRVGSGESGQRRSAETP